MARYDQPLGAPRPGNRSLDLVVVICLIACGAFLWHASSSRKPVSEPSTPTPAPGARMAPAFSLPVVGGSSFGYEGGKGPALIVLTAVGCQGCRERVGKIDAAAVAWARSQAIPVWNIFVYAGVEAGAAFKAEMNPSADRFLADADGSVSVGAYKGSDESCWILIGPASDIIWQGGTDLEALQKAWGGLVSEVERVR